MIFFVFDLFSCLGVPWTDNNVVMNLSCFRMRDNGKIVPFEMPFAPVFAPLRAGAWGFLNTKQNNT